MRILALLFIPLVLNAGDISLIWENPNPTNVPVFGYKLYRFGLTTTNWIGSTTNLNLVATNVNLSLTNIYSVTATNNWGESLYSTPVVILPLNPPINLANKMLTKNWEIIGNGSLLRSYDLTNWTEHIRNLSMNTIYVKVTDDAFGRQQFFKLYTNIPPVPPQFPTR